MSGKGNLTSITVNEFQEAVAKILREYGDVVYLATEEGLDAAEKVLVRNLKAVTPSIKNPPKGYKKKNFAKGWKGTGRKYKLARFVGNVVTVTSKSGEAIYLSNIFEYSTIRGKPFIKKTFEKSINEMAAATVEAIKKGV